MLEMIKRGKISIENIENEDIAPSSEMKMQSKEKENIDIEKVYLLFYIFIVL